MTCSKYGVWGAEAEDFASFIRMKLMEDDYSVIRKFRAESGLKTYLATVVVRQFHDYWRERRGRWRRSAAAERLGPPAGDLEALVYRDGYRLDQAGEKLRTAGRTTLSDTELARLLDRLPLRAPLRPVEVDADPALAAIEGPYTADERVVNAEAEARHVQAMAELDQALARLDSEDQLIVRMHFQDGRTLADVARELDLDRKSLPRRVQRLRGRLREYLEDVRLRDFNLPGILGPDGLPIKQEDLQRSRIITDVISANEKLLRMVRRDPRSVYNLSPREFEELVAELLDQQGYEIALTPPSKDGGFDMYAARKDGLGEFLYLVECKRYALDHRVGVEIVRGLYGVVEKEKASAGIVVTTSHFTKGAHEFQRSVSHRMSLRDYIHLQQWLGVTVLEPAPNAILGIGR